jgi:hypothetical protein
MWLCGIVCVVAGERDKQAFVKTTRQPQHTNRSTLEERRYDNSIHPKLGEKKNFIYLFGTTWWKSSAVLQYISGKNLSTIFKILSTILQYISGKILSTIFFEQQNQKNT